MKPDLLKEILNNTTVILRITIQQLHDEIVFEMAVAAKKMTGEKYLCLAGGSALNSVSNGKLVKKGIIENI